MSANDLTRDEAEELFEEWMAEKAATRSTVHAKEVCLYADVETTRKNQDAVRRVLSARYDKVDSGRRARYELP